MVTLLDHTARTRRTSSATSTPRRTLARSPSRSARRLLTPPTSRSVKKLSPLTVKSHTRRFTTVPRLLLMDIMVVMEDITSTCIFYIRDLKINEKSPQKKKKKNPPKKKKKKKKKK